MNVSCDMCECLPEALDGKLFADIAFSLVLGGLGGSDAVEDRQPHHRLGLQAHPLQEVRHLNSRFPRGLDEEEDGVMGGQRVNNPNIKQHRERHRMSRVLPF